MEALVGRWIKMKTSDFELSNKKDFLNMLGLESSLYLAILERNLDMLAGTEYFLTM